MVHLRKKYNKINNLAIVYWLTAAMVKFVSLSIFPALAHTEIRVLANHLPPYMTIEEIEGEKTYSGFEHELSLLLSERLDWKLIYIECEWQTCFNKLTMGEIDLAHSLLRSKPRETFMEYIEPAYLTRNFKTVFFQRFDDNRAIKQFSDLVKEGYVVGYLGSTVYFPELEDTETLLKIDVKNSELGLKLLIAGKIDVMAGFDNFFTGMEKANPNINKLLKKAKYQPSAILSSYTALSKRSALLPHKPDIAKVLQTLRDEGEIDKLTKKWIDD